MNWPDTFSWHRNILSPKPPFHLIVAPPSVGILLLVTMGNVLVGKPQHQFFQVLRKIVRKLDFADGCQPCRLFSCYSGILKRRKAREKLKDRNPESIVVSFPMKDALHGFWGGIEWCHACLSHHKCIFSGIRADTKIDKNNMLPIIIRDHICRLKILMENSGVMYGFQSLNN